MDLSVRIVGHFGIIQSILCNSKEFKKSINECNNHLFSQIVTMVGAKKVEDLEFSEGLAASNVTEEMYSRVLELYSNVILAQVRNSSKSSSDLLCARQVSKLLGPKPFLS